MGLNSQEKIGGEYCPNDSFRLPTAVHALRNAGNRLDAFKILLDISQGVQNSFAEEVDADIGGIYEDAYEKNNIGYVRNGIEGWRRAEKNVSYSPCRNMELYYVEAWKRGKCIPLIQNDPDTVWLYKDDMERMTMLTNLATGEVFLPGEELCAYLSKRIKNGTANTNINVRFLPKAIRNNLRIHFTRLVYPLQLPRYREFHELRDRLLRAFCSQKKVTNSIVQP